MAAAVRTGLADGKHVPLETIAADAGVGIGTLYRRYPNREALLEALAVRACHLTPADVLVKAPSADSRPSTLEQLLENFAERSSSPRPSPAHDDAEPRDRGRLARAPPGDVVGGCGGLD